MLPRLIAVKKVHWWGSSTERRKLPVAIFPPNTVPQSPQRDPRDVHSASNRKYMYSSGGGIKKTQRKKRKCRTVVLVVWLVGWWWVCGLLVCLLAGCRWPWSSARFLSFFEDPRFRNCQQRETNCNYPIQSSLSGICGSFSTLVSLSASQAQVISVATFIT